MGSELKGIAWPAFELRNTVGLINGEARFLLAIQSCPPIQTNAGIFLKGDLVLILLISP